MNDEGRVCDLKRQLMTTVPPPLGWISAVSTARVGADAQPVAARDSKTAMRTATRFMISSLATTRLTFLDGVRRSWLRQCWPKLDAPDLAGDVDDQAELGYLLVVAQRVALGGR